MTDSRAAATTGGRRWALLVALALVVVAVGLAAASPAATGTEVDLWHSPATPETGERVSLVAETDLADPSAARYEWTVDGERTFTTGEPYANVTFRRPGEHTVSVRVVPPDGEAATDGATLSVSGESLTTTASPGTTAPPETTSTTAPPTTRRETGTQPPTARTPPGETTAPPATTPPASTTRATPTSGATTRRTPTPSTATPGETTATTAPPTSGTTGERTSAPSTAPPETTAAGPPTGGGTDPRETTVRSPGETTDGGSGIPGFGVGAALAAALVVAVGSWRRARR